VSFVDDRNRSPEKAAIPSNERRYVMMVGFAVFSALALCAGILVSKLYEWRTDVLYGPYIDRNHLDRKSERSSDIT
jgi:hypothetical protein